MLAGGLLDRLPDALCARPPACTPVVFHTAVLRTWVRHEGRRSSSTSAPARALDRPEPRPASSPGTGKVGHEAAGAPLPRRVDGRPLAPTRAARRAVDWLRRRLRRAGALHSGGSMLSIPSRLPQCRTRSRTSYHPVDVGPAPRRLSSPATMCRGATAVVGALEHVLDGLLVGTRLSRLRQSSSVSFQGLCGSAWRRLEAPELLVVGEVEAELDEDRASAASDGSRSMIWASAGCQPQSSRSAGPARRAPGRTRSGKARPCRPSREGPARSATGSGAASRRRWAPRTARRGHGGSRGADQSLDTAALAGSVPTLEQHAQRRADSW